MRPFPPFFTEKGTRWRLGRRFVVYRVTRRVWNPHGFQTNRSGNEKRRARAQNPPRKRPQARDNGSRDYRP